MSRFVTRWTAMGTSLAVVLLSALSFGAYAGVPPERIRGVYLNPNSHGEKKVTLAIEKAKEAGLTAVVLHVKDPFGYVYWQSTNPLAVAIGAVKGKGRVETALARFHEAGLWTIAKLDVFEDTQLSKMRPTMAVIDASTKKPWVNKHKLGWTNPYDADVWDYILALADEVAALGFDEVQFDYVRFPSDGKLANIQYPKVQEDKAKAEVIGAFLTKAQERLAKKGVVFSVDLFGMVAWKADDFGVGQRIEDIAEHVDAMCPMLYPSHFPANFFGKANAKGFPEKIMERSLARYQERTKIPVRPWVQAYGYSVETINEQLDGIEKAKVDNWLFWNPASDFTRTYEALAARAKAKAKKAKEVATEKRPSVPATSGGGG